MTEEQKKRYEQLEEGCLAVEQIIRERLQKFGGKLVYTNDEGVILEELPDGTIRPLTEGDGEEVITM
jgi:hypothetical protein